MTTFLDVIGTIGLLVGAALWVAMFKAGMGVGQHEAPAEEPPASSDDSSGDDAE